MYDIYEQIKESKDEAKFVELVKNGELKPDAVDKEGITPLLFAVDNSFSVETLE